MSLEGLMGPEEDKRHYWAMQRAGLGGTISGTPIFYSATAKVRATGAPVGLFVTPYRQDMLGKTNVLQARTEAVGASGRDTWLSVAVKRTADYAAQLEKDTALKPLAWVTAMPSEIANLECDEWGHLFEYQGGVKNARAKYIDIKLGTVAHQGYAPPEKKTAPPPAPKPSPQPAPPKKSGCFIATAAYSTPLDPRINVLRQFRDERLLADPLGRAFVKGYYTVSPPIAHAVSLSETLKWAVRGLIAPLVRGR